MSAPQITRVIILRRRQGLHLRLASQVIALVQGFPGQVSIHHGDRCADANSMFEMMQLIALPDSKLEVVAVGEGGDAILNGLEELFSRVTDEPDAG